MVSEIQKEILDVLSILEVQSVTCGKIRIGGPNDGGYVMADNFLDNTVAYSIGVGPQVQWDVDMASRGMTIHQYDHTVPGLPQDHPSFHFNKLGIGPDLNDPELITLEEMLRRNGDLEKQNMLLKIDVEGAEWNVFDAMDSKLLARFDQIVIEFHGLEYLADASFRDRCRRVFQKITKYHTPVHVHANNYADARVIENIHIPPVIEMSLCLRSRFDFYPSQEIFPTQLDEPCLASKPDIFVGSFRFKSRAS